MGNVGLTIDVGVHLTAPLVLNPSKDSPKSNY